LPDLSFGLCSLGTETNEWRVALDDSDPLEDRKGFRNAAFSEFFGFEVLYVFDESCDWLKCLGAAGDLDEGEPGKLTTNGC
jgi:hypothetical protein